VTTAVHIPCAFETVIGARHATVGASVSLTVTVKVVDASLPAASETVQVTVETPRGKTLPAAGTQTGVPTPAQLSDAVAAG
jgi:hypothetical protein